jgi:hypothetical protein
MTGRVGEAVAVLSVGTLFADWHLLGAGGSRSCSSSCSCQVYFMLLLSAKVGSYWGTLMDSGRSRLVFRHDACMTSKATDSS